MGEFYTLGNWFVKEGKDEEFVKAWQEFAEWTGDNIPDVGAGHLIKDIRDESHYFSFGSWGSLAAIEKWRQTKEFGEFVLRIKPLCDKFEPFTLEEVASSENK